MSKLKDQFQPLPPDQVLNLLNTVTSSNPELTGVAILKNIGALIETGEENGGEPYLLLKNLIYYLRRPELVVLAMAEPSKVKARPLDIEIKLSMSPIQES